MPNLDLSRNYLAWTNTQTIRLRVVRRDKDIDYQLDNVRRHIIQKTEAEESGGAVVARDVVFNIPAAKILTDVYEPEVGYLILDRADDSRQYTILQVDEASQSSRYRCTCRNLALTDGLADTIEVWSPTYRKDAAGGDVGEFLPKYQGVQCKVQEVSGTDTTEHTRQGTVLEYRITLGRRLYVDSTDQIRWGKPGTPPTLLNLLSHEGADSLNRLQVLVCRKGLW